MLDGYLLSVQRGARGKLLAPQTVYQRIAVVCQLAAYQKYLSRDRIVLNPWEGRSVAQVVGLKVPTENTTPRIPEMVLKPLIQWALFYVQTAAPDIFAARQELDHFSEQESSHQTEKERLGVWLELRRTEKRGIPAPEPAFFGREKPGKRLQGVNYRLVQRMCGLAISNWDRKVTLKAMLQEAVAELGLEPGGMDTPIVGRLSDGRPWRGRFSPHSLKIEKRVLMAACFIIIAYFSGMRGEEAVNLILQL